MSGQPEGSVQRIDTPAKLPPRRPDAHKGDFGRVLVVGGSRGMIGAPALAANAALRGGAGLVTVAVPESIQLPVATLCPCATSVPLPCDGGRLKPESVRVALAAAGSADAVAAGPGLGVSGGTDVLVRALLELDKPVVLDADGINHLARIDDWPRLRKCPMVLTPHPGEFARVSGLSIDQIQADRKAVAIEAARRWSRDGGAPLVVALKGAGTVVSDGRRVFVNTTGNPGMATGGSGDVLTGLIAALVAQGMACFDAACLGVHVHGIAGDLAADEIGQVATIATDLVDLLAEALAEAGQ